MNVLLRLLRLYAPLTPWLAASIAIGALTALASVGLMAVSGWFITAMAAAGLAGVTMNYFTPAAIVRALAILRTGGRYFERLVSHDATLRLTAETRAFLFARLVPLAPSGLADARSGDLLARLKNDIDRVELLFLRLVAPLFVAAMTLAVVALVLAHLGAGLALTVLAVLIGGGLLAPALAAYAGRRATAAMARQTAMLKRAVVDDIEKLGPLIVTGAVTGHLEALAAHHAALLAAETSAARLAATGQALAGLSGDVALLAVLIIGIPLVGAGSLAGPDLTMAALLSLAAAEALMGLPGALAGLAATIASAERLFALIDRPAPVSDAAVPTPLPPSNDLVLTGVHLRYGADGRDALADIDLTIATGRRLAIVGCSGAGKSSLADLLVRARDPSAGTITLGGVPLADLRLDDLRRRVALVPQKPHIFTSTLGANLRLAKPDASPAELADALARAGLADLVARLPDGLDTRVGLAGSTLSGGEARRLALARALLADAPVLVLDEPGEGLDPTLERDVIAALMRREPGRTVILFTHGSAGLADVDEIIELADGRVLDRRPPDRQTSS